MGLLDLVLIAAIDTSNRNIMSFKNGLKIVCNNRSNV
jgi:hypothetical protein